MIESDIIITTFDKVEDIFSLEDTWEELHANCTNQSIYNSFDFVFESIKAYTDNETHEQIITLTNRLNSQLIAIFPMQFVHSKDPLSFKITTYEYTALDEIDKPYPVIREGYSDISWKAFIKHLNNNVKHWHRLLLTEMPLENTDLDLIHKLCEQYNLKFRIGSDGKGPIINLDNNWDTFEKQHKKMRKKIAKMKRDFTDQLDFKVYTNEWDVCLEQYIQLEKKGWKSEDNVGICRDDKTLSFYKSLFEKLSAKGNLYFGFLRVDKQLVSAEIAYSSGENVYFCHGCYDSDYEKYSPGMVSTSLLIKHFFSMDYTSGDFLCGYSGYLNSWSDKIIKTCSIYIDKSPNTIFVNRILKATRNKFNKLVLRKRSKNKEYKNFKYDAKYSSDNEVEIVSHLEAKNISESEWHELSRASLFPNPFYERWNLVPALEFLSNDKDLFLVLVRQKGKLVGLFPIEIKKCFYFAKIIQIWSHKHCFVSDPLLSVDIDFGEIIDLLNDRLNADWFYIPAHNRHLLNYGDNVFFHLKTRAGIFSDRNDSYTQHHKGKFLRENRRLYRNLSKNFDIKYVEHRNKAEGLERFKDLENKGWKHSRKTSIKSSKSISNYYDSLIADQAANDKIQFQELWANDQLIAASFRLTTGKHWFDVKTTYNEGFSQYSPGRLLELENLGQLDPNSFNIIDSCTSTDNYMINKIWPDQLTFQDSIVFHDNKKGRLWRFLFRLKNHFSSEPRL